MAADHSDSGASMQELLKATSKPEWHPFEIPTRQVSLRNLGTNTLWLSFDKKIWFDVACGTSYDERVREKGFWYRTQTGRTFVAVMGVALHAVNNKEER